MSTVNVEHSKSLFLNQKFWTEKVSLRVQIAQTKGLVKTADEGTRLWMR